MTWSLDVIGLEISRNPGFALDFFIKSSDILVGWHSVGSNAPAAGGEEDGVNNEDANPEDLYSKPEERNSGS